MTSRAMAASPTARPVPVNRPLTDRDRADLARYGRGKLVQRLRRRATAGWLAFTGAMFTGLTVLSMSPIEDNTGLWITMAAMPAMAVAAHNQGRLARLRANDPDAPPRALPMGTTARPGDQLEDATLNALGLVRDRLLGNLPLIEPRYPEVAAEIRRADAQAYASLLAQAEGLAALDALPLVDHDPTLAARAEIQARLESAIASYQQLLAESVLLLSRSDATAYVQPPLDRARDVVATYSEGLRVAQDPTIS